MVRPISLVAGLVFIAACGRPQTVVLQSDATTSDDQRRHHHDLGGGFDRRHIERGVMRTEDGVERWPRISPRPLCS